MSQPAIPASDLERFVQRTSAVTAEASRLIRGQSLILRQLLIAVLARGHVLLEGVPGTGKTLMARVLAHLLGLSFKRIQFTPDLMPADVIGTSIFDLERREFRLVKGPVFTEFLLADEINRSPAKTQAALLEAMQERRVTIDGTGHLLSDAFLVVATQNPIESEGTYPLPEAQLDRFLVKLQVPYPDEHSEDELLRLHDRGFDGWQFASIGLNVILASGELAWLQRVASQIRVSDAVLHYVRQLVCSTRNHHALLLGAGPRAGIGLLAAAKAHAALECREFVVPDDVVAMARPVLCHRLLLQPDLELDGVTATAVFDTVLSSVAVPR